MKNSLSLRVSDRLSLPVDLVTQTSAVVGVRGSGKTTTAVVFVEELLGLGYQVIVVDPLDAWFGLRSSADGKKAGFPVVVFGGEHGDVPLLASNGTAVADFLVESRTPAILSMRHFESQAEERKFVTDFCLRLFTRKGTTELRTPLLLVIDEASLFVPQRVAGEQARMVGAIQKLVRQGRTSGIGVCLIDQRPATVNKDVLTQVEMLVVHRITSPQDRKAIESWIEYQGSGKEALTTLETLQTGEAWVWSPHWLGIFERTKIRRRNTFDSSATPKAGQSIAPPKQLAEVDLDELRLRMSETIERSKAEDPKELRKKITQLERELQSRSTEVKRIEIPALSEKYIARVLEATREITDVGRNLELLILSLTPVPSGRHALVTLPEKPLRTASPARVAEAKWGGEKLTPTESIVLQTVAQFPSGATRQRVAVMSGRSIKSSSFQASFPALEQKGLISKLGEKYSATSAGAKVGGATPLPSGPELLEHWLRKLTPSEQKVLRAIADAYPKRITRETVADRTGQSTKSSSFQASFPALRDLELIEGHADFRASEAFFGGGE